MIYVVFGKRRKRKMIHASEKYNKGHMDTIPENEPVFLLRAQDETAAATVRFWLSLQPPYSTRYHEVLEHVRLMEAWGSRKIAD